MSDIFDKARLLIESAGENGWEKMPNRQAKEIAAFIKRPELRKVAESVLEMRQSFSSITVLRKLLEADEALSRAGAIHIELEARIEFGQDDEPATDEVKEL